LDVELQPPVPVLLLEHFDIAAVQGLVLQRGGGVAYKGRR
jgi:hypothetical protein